MALNEFGMTALEMGVAQTQVGCNQKAKKRKLRAELVLVEYSVNFVSDFVILTMTMECSGA